jgi:hypothetical protein
VVKGRYDEKAILAEVLSENEDAATLRDAVHGKPDETARNDRMALGELVNNAIVAKRQLDTRQTIEALDKLGLTVNPREPTHEFDAVHVACLAEVAKEDELEKAVGKLAEAWQGRVSVRLLGPLAPYDFVTTTQEQHG